MKTTRKNLVVPVVLLAYSNEVNLIVKSSFLAAGMSKQVSEQNIFN